MIEATPRPANRLPLICSEADILLSKIGPNITAVEAPGSRLELASKRVLLIGGAGFLGTSIALKLAQFGAAPLVVDQLKVNSLGALERDTYPADKRSLYTAFIQDRLAALDAANIEILVKDARNFDSLQEAFQIHEPEVVIHLAAVAHSSRSNADPYLAFDHGLNTLENALELSRIQGDVQFIYLSSSMVYGNFPSPTVTEESPCNPLGIYGSTKFGGEKLVIAYSQISGMPYTIVRPSSVYGPGCVSRRVIQAFIENALSGHPLKVQGDGREFQDYTFIDDIGDFFTLAAANPAAYNEIFNATRGEGRMIIEAAELVQKHFPQVEIEHTPADPLIPKRGTLDISKAQELLGFAPTISIDAGIPRYVESYEKLSVTHPEVDVKNSAPFKHE